MAPQGREQIIHHSPQAFPQAIDLELTPGDLPGWLELTLLQILDQGLDDLLSPSLAVEMSQAGGGEAVEFHDAMLDGGHLGVSSGELGQDPGVIGNTLPVAVRLSWV